MSTNAIIMSRIAFRNEWNKLSQDVKNGVAAVQTLEPIEITATRLQTNAQGKPSQVSVPNQEIKPQQTEPAKPEVKKAVPKKRTFLQRAERDLKKIFNPKPNRKIDYSQDGFYLLATKQSDKIGNGLVLGVGASTSDNYFKYDLNSGVKYTNHTGENLNTAGGLVDGSLTTQPLLSNYNSRLKRNIASVSLGTSASALMSSAYQPVIKSNSGIVANLRPLKGTNIETTIGYGTETGAKPGLTLDCGVTQGLSIDRKGKSRFDIFAKVRHMFDSKLTESQVGVAVKF